MEITKKAKEEIEARLQRVERLIAQRGIGSGYLNRAKRVQRNINLAIVLGGAITITGILAWLLTRGNDDEA